MALKIKGKAKKTLTTSAQDGEILAALGLLQKYHAINVLAGTNGYESGSVTCIVVTGMANQVEIEVCLADKILTLTLPKNTYSSIIQYYNMDETIPEGTEIYDYAEELQQEITQFYGAVMSHLSMQGESPTMQLIAKGKAGYKNSEGNVEVEVSGSKETLDSITIAHTCKTLEADPEIGAKQLENATRLYEPVFGTSGGSRYHCVLITTAGVKIAARYKNNTLSVKAIVPKGYANLPQLTGQLNSMGLNLKDAGHYSCHYSNVTKDIAQRTLGALVMCFDPDEVITGLPVLTRFADHGM
ncbi:transporter [Vibrio phage vB_VpS_PG28]|nr:transporter [Vibrio phage vB_VpS_PG28]